MMTNKELKVKNCYACGYPMEIWIEKKGKCICQKCNDFYEYKFKRSHHFLWVLQMALDSLEEKINDNQSKILEMKAKDDAGMEYFHYKLENDTRQKRIQSMEEFLHQYIDIHKWLKQFFLIARHKHMVDDAQAIAEWIINRNK